MTDKITVLHNMQTEVTVLPNKFIDEYMGKADGEYVKIYLLVLRLTGSKVPVDVDEIADRLELTRKDVLRALSYWEKEGLLHMGKKEEEGGAPVLKTPDQAEPSLTRTVPQKPVLSPEGLENSMKNADFERTIFMAETYIGRPFSSTEMNSFCYISDGLSFSPDLMEYLIEYCVSRGKKSVRYIESVAIRWYQQGITSVAEAKEQSALYTQNVFPVMKAFGISGRDPGSAELDYIKKWNALDFDSEIIIEACSRSLLATHQASFPYANKILEEWKKLGVKSMADIRRLDEKRRAATSPASKPETKATRSSGPKSSNQFHNFEQRTYDYGDLESRLLDKNRR